MTLRGLNNLPALVTHQQRGKNASVFLLLDNGRPARHTISPPRFLTSIQQTCKGYDTCRLKASQRFHFRPSGLAFGRLTAEVLMLFERPSVQRRNVYTSIIPNGDRMRSRLSIFVARGEKKEHRLLPVVCVLCEYVCTWLKAVYFGTRVFASLSLVGNMYEHIHVLVCARARH